MRTALILLLMLAGASVIGSLIPQLPNSPEKVFGYTADHPLAAEIYSRLGFFDVFGAWWFSLIITLLVVSLIACLIPRTRGTVRSVRQKPIQAREIDSFPHYEERNVTLPAGAATTVCRKVLRRKLFRVAASENSLAAEKGSAREIGSLLFHWAFLLIVVGAIYGKGTGYSGRAAVIEGETWTDSLAGYDGSIRTGRFFGGDFSGSQIRLKDFEDTFRASGIPMDFVSRVDLLNPDGSLVRAAEIRVNHPATFAGVRVFQYGFGWAPVVQVRDDGKLLWSGPVAFSQDTAPEGVPQLALPWRGVLKLPSLDPQVGITLELWPDGQAFLQTQLTGQPVVMVVARDPIIRFTTYSGPLTDPSQRRLDTSIMKEQAAGILGQGQVVDLTTGRALETGADPNAGLTISFPDLRKYSVFEVSRDNGVWMVLLAAILVLLGLLPALYTSKRKVWVRLESGEGRTILKVGGFAVQRKSQFSKEFSDLVAALERAAGKVNP